MQKCCICFIKEYVLGGTNRIPTSMRNIYIAPANVQKNQNVTIVTIAQGSTIGAYPLKCDELMAGYSYTMTVGNYYNLLCK